MQLGYNLLVYSNLKCHIAYWNRVTESTLNLSDSEASFAFVCLSVFLNEGLNWLDCSDDVWNWEEDTLASDHITDFEHNIRLYIQKLINLLFVRFLFRSESLFDSVFDFLLDLDVFSE